MNLKVESAILPLLNATVIISVKPSNTIKVESTVQLPKKYHHYADVFDKVQANTLPHHRPYDCPIDLQPGKEPPWGPIYNISPTELEVLRAYIEDQEMNGRPRFTPDMGTSSIRLCRSASLMRQQSSSTWKMTYSEISWMSV